MCSYLRLQKTIIIVANITNYNRPILSFTTISVTLLMTITHVAFFQNIFLKLEAVIVMPRSHETSNMDSYCCNALKLHLSTDSKLEIELEALS